MADPDPTAEEMRGPGLRAWIAGLLGIYGLLGLVCALGLVLDSPIVAVGFHAWGGVLPLAAGLIAVASRPRGDDVRLF